METYREAGSVVVRLKSVMGRSGEDVEAVAGRAWSSILGEGRSDGGCMGKPLANGEDPACVASNA